MVQTSSSIILNIRQTVDLFAKKFHTEFPLGHSLSENKLVKLTFLIRLWDLREPRLSANTQWKQYQLNCLDSGVLPFTLILARKRLHEGLYRGGEETVFWRIFQIIQSWLYAISSFYFPFYFSRPDSEGFFFLDQIFHSVSLCFWLLAHCTSHLLPHKFLPYQVCLYVTSVSVHVPGYWCRLIMHSKSTFSLLTEGFYFSNLTERELLF